MSNSPRYTPKRRKDRNEVGRVVARMRSKLTLTQEDLAGRAAAIGWLISRDVIKRIERGEREVTDIELKNLAKALRVPPALLLE
jgi:transcriptional regulator with XRE-family HTH domain